MRKKIAKLFGVKLAPRILERFLDGELHIEIQQSLRGVQPTSPPVEEHFFELFSMNDACRRAGASRLTAAIPYFGYARQDRR
ncbi:MAG TPA: ribose-phosphate pyrophosphokinase-like domain-containing protein, partial [Methylomirabilota bacterium]|nr:ribose-phosphate pyrophosphokinase-like domain-containing protein [Methylomirabilota bacterium]